MQAAVFFTEDWMGNSNWSKCRAIWTQKENYQWVKYQYIHPILQTLDFCWFSAWFRIGKVKSLTGTCELLKVTVIFILYGPKSIILVEKKCVYLFHFHCCYRACLMQTPVRDMKNDWQYKSGIKGLKRTRRGFKEKSKSRCETKLLKYIILES